MHIQSNLRQPGVIDGAPLIWPRRTSASRFTTVGTGRFGTGSGKNRHRHTTTLARFSISLSLSQLHYNENLHQHPASFELQNKYVQHSLSFSLCLPTQSLNTKQEHEACKYYTYTPNIISIHRCSHTHTHTYSLPLPHSNADERDLQGSETKERVTLSQIITWWKSPAFH